MLVLLPLSQAFGCGLGLLGCGVNAQTFPAVTATTMLTKFSWLRVLLRSQLEQCVASLLCQPAKLGHVVDPQRAVQLSASVGPAVVISTVVRVWHVVC